MIAHASPSHRPHSSPTIIINNLLSLSINLQLLLPTISMMASRTRAASVGPQARTMSMALTSSRTSRRPTLRIMSISFLRRCLSPSKRGTAAATTMTVILPDTISFCVPIPPGAGPTDPVPRLRVTPNPKSHLMYILFLAHFSHITPRAPLIALTHRSHTQQSPLLIDDGDDDDDGYHNDDGI